MLLDAGSDTAPPVTPQLPSPSAMASSMGKMGEEEAAEEWAEEAAEEWAEEAEDEDKGEAYAPPSAALPSMGSASFRRDPGMSMGTERCRASPRGVSD